jgi:hypothetical protein
VAWWAPCWRSASGRAGRLGDAAAARGVNLVCAWRAGRLARPLDLLARDAGARRRARSCAGKRGIGLRVPGRRRISESRRAGAAQGVAAALIDYGSRRRLRRRWRAGRPAAFSIYYAATSAITFWCSSRQPLLWKTRDPVARGRRHFPFHSRRIERWPSRAAGVTLARGGRCFGLTVPVRTVFLADASEKRREIDRCRLRPSGMRSAAAPCGWRSCHARGDGVILGRRLPARRWRLSWPAD